MRFDRDIAEAPSPQLTATIAEFKRVASTANAPQATRVSSQKTLDALAKIQRQSPRRLGRPHRLE